MWATWTKLKYWFVVTVLMLLSVSSVCYAVDSPTSSIESEKTQGVITLPLSKLESLQTILDEQDKLLQTLEYNSIKQRSTLVEQDKQLQQAESKIQKLSTSLQLAESSLGSAENLIKEQERSLEKLSAQIKREKKQATIKGVGVGLLTGLLLTVLITK